MFSGFYIRTASHLPLTVKMENAANAEGEEMGSVVNDEDAEMEPTGDPEEKYFLDKCREPWMAEEESVQNLSGKCFFNNF